MKKNMICIICPRGCAMTAEVNGEAVTVTGNTCPKGEEYAINECLHPMRTVTAAIRVANRENTMVSVKTAASIPKEKMFEAMKMIRAAKANAPIKIGDVLLADVFGADIIATKNID